MTKQNGSLYPVASDTEGSSDAPASSYYDEDDVRSPVPEAGADKLRKAGGLNALEARIVSTERQQAIAGVDLLWLLLTDATDLFNPSCSSVSTMRSRVTLQMLAEYMTKQFDKFPRYRQRLERTGRWFQGAVFVDDPDFDIYKHIRVERLPEPAGKRELEALIGKFIGEPWNIKKQLVQTILVENYHDENGAVCAILAKGHHTLSDGLGFVISQLYVSSYRDELVQMMDGAATKLRKAKRGLLLPSEYSKALKPLDPFASNHPVAPFVYALLGLLFWSSYVIWLLQSLFWSTYHWLTIVPFNLLVSWRIEKVVDSDFDSPKPREYSSSRALSIQDVKLCQQAFSGARPGAAVAGVPRDQRTHARSKVKHVTLNDVVCSVMVDVLASEIARKPSSNSIRDKLKQAMDKVSPPPVPFFVPMSLRAPDNWSMRNLSTGASVLLYPSRNLRLQDTSVRDIYEHIHACRYQLGFFKYGLWPKLLFHALQITGRFPILSPLSWFPKSKENWLVVRLVRKWVVKPLTDSGISSYTAVLTNLPGPHKTISAMDNVEVEQLIALPPQGGPGSLGIGVISYAGNISIAVSSDTMPGQEGVARRVCEAFEARFDMYVERAREVLEHQD